MKLEDAEVIGMFAPIQDASLHADDAFAVTDAQAVQEAEIRIAIEQAGFGVLSVNAPDAS